MWHTGCLGTVEMLKRFLPLLALASLMACTADTEEGAESASEIVARPKACSDRTATGTCLLKVVTINLRHDVDEWSRRRPLVIAELNRLAPDLIGLQELQINEDQGDEISDGLRIDYQRYEHRKQGIIGWFSGEGIGVYSRFPIKEKGDIDLGERRLALRAEVELPQGVRIDFYNTHLHHTGGDDIRLPQAREVADWMEDGGASRVILTGDFNAKDNSEAVKHIVSRGYTDSFKALHGEDANAIGATFPAPLREGAPLEAKNRIDFIFSKGSLRPVASEVVLKNHDAEGFYPSDHLAVMTTYEVTL